MNAALRALMDCAGVATGDEVLILLPAEGGHAEVGERVRAAVEARGATARDLRPPPFQARVGDVPEVLAGPLLAADVLIDLAGHESLVHTPTARRAVREGRLRLVSVSLDAPTDWRSPFATFPMDALFARARAAAAILEPGGIGRLTTADGTDLVFEVRPRAVIGMPGGASPGPLVRGKGGFALFPPGAIGTSPRAARGTIVLDGLLGFAGRLAEPIELGVEDGFVRHVRGGPEADWLRERIARHENGGHVAKLLAGIHPAAPVDAGLAELDRRKARLSRAEGVVLVGLGDALSVGGEIASGWHWDGVVLGPVRWMHGDRPLFVAGTLQDAPRAAHAAVDEGTPPHAPTPLLRAGELTALVVNVRGRMPHAHRNPECDELWVPLGSPSLDADLDGRRIGLGEGLALVVPRGLPHRVHGGSENAAMLVIERLPARSAPLPTQPAAPQLLDLAALAERPTPHWSRPPRVLARAGSFVVEGYVRPEGMLRPTERPAAPEVWICVRGGLSVAHEGAPEALSAAPGGVIGVPAGGACRIVSTCEDTVALRIVTP